MLRNAAGRLRPQLPLRDHVLDETVVDQVEHAHAGQLRLAKLLEDRHERGRRVQESELRFDIVESVLRPRSPDQLPP